MTEYELLLFSILTFDNDIWPSVRTWQCRHMVAPLGRWPRLNNVSWQLSASPKPTAMAPAEGKHSLITQAETFQPSRVLVLAVGVRKTSSGRSGLLLMVEKNFPKLSHTSLGNVSVTQQHTPIQTVRLILSSYKATKTQPTNQTKYFSSFCVYLLLLLPQLADRQERKPDKKKKVFFWSQGPSRTASHGSCRRWYRKHI